MCGGQHEQRTQTPLKGPIVDITKDLSALFTQQVQATPDTIALEDSSVSLTYRELDKKVTTLANHLLDLNVGRDSLVGVLFERCANYVIACLAILRAGGAFLVLELAYPPDLLADVLEDAEPCVVLTNKERGKSIVANIPLVFLDDPLSFDNKAGSSNGHVARANGSLRDDHDLDKLAFVCYTSGTTGRPKGILNSHRAVVLSYDMRFRLNDVYIGDRVAANVFFIWEMLRPLLRGATVVCIPDEASYDPSALVDILSSRRITETLMTPTLLATVLSNNAQISTKLADLRTLWFNGEVVTKNLATRAIKSLPMTRLLNCYSTSETHEIACGDIQDMIDQAGTCCPVGFPMDPTHTYILNSDGEELFKGEKGELWVGSFLARGYLNLPEVTAKSFKKDPFDAAPEARIYRTGDEARILPSGLLEIMGRVGGMLKVRGYSVVPGKVESAILSTLAVSHCAVVSHGDGLERQLVAYFVRDDETEGRTVLEITENGYCPNARRTLASSLAQYMIPALWVELNALPTHQVSGKVDLKRLPPPIGTKKGPGAGQNGVPGDQSAETDLATIVEEWANVLKVPSDAVQQGLDFFDLGGHSLSLATLAGKLSSRFGFSVPLQQLAGNPTLHGHLDTVRSARDGHTAAVQKDLPAILRADCVLPPEIQPTNSALCPLNEANTILLTGATGFLGAFLLHDLLKSVSARIICLVRSKDRHRDGRVAGIAALRRNLLDLGLWQDSIMDQVEILPGDISKRQLGLTPTEFEELAARVQVIVHAAATVNLVYPYAALRGANVGGTREILRLACLGGATLQYVSTNGVLPPSKDGWSEDAMLDIDVVPEKLDNGYSQTKWVAEQLVQKAGRRGLPTRIYRLGTLSGHSSSGATNTSDLLSALIVESLHLDYAPDVSDWRIEMTPVDFISSAIIALANNTRNLQRWYHLGESKPVNADTVFAAFSKIGYPTEKLPWNEWITMWNERRGLLKGNGGEPSIDVLHGGMPTVDFLKNPIILNNQATNPLLAGIDRPKIDAALLEVYARHWYTRGWLPRPPIGNSGASRICQSSASKPLFGKVAVVTGASSGIGAAVGAALAREGTHVALAARRTDKLESLRRKLLVHGGKIIIHKTDVSVRTEVESLMHATNDKLGPVDILVSCAGVMYYTMMANAHIEEWERTVDVNCKGLLHCLSSVVPPMIKRGKGHIVAISSDAGRKVFPGLGVYSASKFFVEATLQSLRLETAGTGLRVTSVQPGNTATELLAMSTDREALKKYGEPTGAQVLSADDVANSIVHALKQPEHVAVNEILIEPRDEPI